MAISDLNNFAPVVNQDLKIVSWLWADQTEVEDDIEVDSGTVKETIADYTVVLSKSQRRKLEKSKRNSPKLISHNTRSRVGSRNCA